MFKRIAFPLDLEHKDRQEKALTIATDLAKNYGAELHLVGVSSSAPEGVAHSPEEFAKKLEQFAQDYSSKHGITAHAKPIQSPDPEAELDKELEKAVHQIDADLVVMESHKPGKLAGIFRTHGGHLASELEISVFVVRE